MELEEIAGWERKSRMEEATARVAVTSAMLQAVWRRSRPGVSGICGADEPG